MLKDSGGKNLLINSQSTIEAQTVEEEVIVAVGTNVPHEVVNVEESSQFHISGQ
ncbi:Hypothetical protein FKW44_007317, partial [Caligus rogercresseyi]